MADNETTLAPSGDVAGPSEIGPDGSQTTEPDPTLSEGQATAAEDQTTDDVGTGDDAGDSFFDPRDLEGKPELQAAYKQMQRAFSKKMEDIAQDRRKIEAYDAFYQDPITQIQRVAQQYGYQLTPAQAQQVAQQAGQQTPSDSWEPQSWEDVLAKAEERAEQRVMQKFAPVLNQVQSMRKASIESQLSEIDPTWQQYEDRMASNLQQHPTLAQDPALLYRMSVPAEVLESRATQAALKKLEKRGQSARVSGGSTTNRNPAGGLPDHTVSFQEAVAAAKKALEEQGIRPGG